MGGPRTRAPLRMARALVRAVDALLPRLCAGCGAPVPGERTLCAGCDARLPRIPDGACTGCQERAGRPEDGRCAACAVPDVLAAAVAAVWLEGEVAHWVRAYKYPEAGLHRLDPRPAAALAELAERAARRAPGPAPDLVVPVPLHPRRLRARGFNPALLVARAAARAAGAPLAPAALVRRRDTPSQTGLDAAARRRNLRGAMAARRSAPPRVWVVDDVLTTGATAREAARALRTAGAREVVALATARTPLRGLRLSPRASPSPPGSPRTGAPDRPAS